MERLDQGAHTADLVSVGLGGPPTTVESVPADVDVLAAGMTYGLLDFG
jgi:hypothetical protein